MNKAIKCSSLDFLTIRPYALKNMAIMAAMIVLISIMNKDTMFPLMMCGMYGIILLSYPFVIGEKNNMDNFYGTLSINRGTIVRGRYIFCILFGIINVVMGVILCLGVNAVFSLNTSIGEILFAASIVFSIYIIMAAIQMPMYFKLGYSKAKFYAMIPIFVIPMVIGMLKPAVEGGGSIVEFGKKIAVIVDKNPGLSAVVVVAFALLLMEISMIISSKLYRDKDR